MGMDTVDNGLDVEILFDDVVDEATLEDFNNLKKKKKINDLSDSLQTQKKTLIIYKLLFNTSSKTE